MSRSENNQLEQIHKHPLFLGVPIREFEQLLEQCMLKEYGKSEKVLYSKTPREGLLLLLSGMAEVYIQNDDSFHDKEVLEVLEAGDIIGFSSLADFLGETKHSSPSYTVEVMAVSNCHCLQIPYSVIEERWHDESVRDFILRQLAVRLQDVYGSLAEQVKLASQWGESEPFVRRMADVMNEPVVSVYTTATVKEVVEKMAKNQTSSVVILNEQNKLVGIMTEKDVVTRIVGEGHPNTMVVENVMTENPYTISYDAYYYEAMSSFLMNGIKHLPVIENDHVVGMVTMADLLRKKNRGTMEILQTIEDASFDTLPEVKLAIYEVLGHLIQDRIPTTHSLEIITKLYDRLVSHCVELAVQSVYEKGGGMPPASFCFMQMGSGGRGEQFLLTDQDHFLVYGEGEGAEVYFENVSQEIVRHLEQAGYSQCLGKMMASEKAWRGTVTDWKEKIRRWGIRATNENILLAQNFLSFRFVHGDRHLYDEFEQIVNTELSHSRIFFYRMAKQEREHPVPTLDHPIRALFRVKRTTLDVKKEALFPFHHSLQMLAAQHHIVGGFPEQKIDALQQRGVFTPSFVEELLYAYETILKIRVDQGWTKQKRNETQTSDIHFTHLRSRDKEQLMAALKTIRSLQQQALREFGMT
ncbi:DUF294 nucleotidyltransferase-like domain-containing protein [Alkalihalobacillus sp. LMS39]|uniref:DUF294 nucleotidyltransferase-like domain-containing protein n=1 Tax=Alkalihalobacillus sp. LMS39 TaxID=2924032 RepID=UPI001FB36A12|nr:DUF294 nucleotidyltransferase-like domain-containing protein [Alkalihalobacillus sp. LMS39]UOE93911.1 DUF294 nucleotidyltransferase-like domain-containing protein [Alkalihalobacillus sp. LMS39]